MMLAALMLCLSSVATAQPDGVDEDKGRELAAEAMQAYQDGEYPAALAKFNEAREVYPAAQVLRLRGYTLLAMERWLDAADALEEALESSYNPLLPRDAEHAQDNLKEVLSKVASVKVSSKVAGATVSIDDGEAQPLPFETRLLPGEYTFVVEADNYDSVAKDEILKAGEKRTLTINPKKITKAGPKPPPPPPPPPAEPETPSDPFGWFPHQSVVGLSIASAGIIAGGIAIAAGAYGTQLRGSVQENIDIHNQNYDAACSTNSDLCRADIALINHDGERAHTMQQVGLYTGIGAGVLLATGVTFWLFADDGPLADDAPDDNNAPPADEVQLSCAPTLLPSGQQWRVGLGCAGSF